MGDEENNLGLNHWFGDVDFALGVGVDVGGQTETVNLQCRVDDHALGALLE